MKCPKCKSEMVLRQGKYGNFWGCSAFPRCKEIVKIKGSYNPAVAAQKTIEKVPYKPVPLSEEQRHIRDLFLSSCGALKRGPFPFLQLSTIPYAEQHLAAPVSIAVPSVPGCGKTTELIELLVAAPTNAKILAACFNQNIRDTLLARVPRTDVDILSVNQLGYRALRNTYKPCNFNQHKLRDIFDRFQAKLSDEEKYDYGIFCAAKKTVEMLKVNLLAPTDDNIEETAFNYGVELSGDSYGDFLGLTQQLYAASLATDEVDYTDQYALPALKRVVYPNKYHIILGDEVQDWSKAQWQTVKNALLPGGIFVLVGDPNQSIYSWRGANPESMEDMTKDCKAEERYMTVSFRCPQESIALAARLVPHIKAAPGAKQGTIIDTDEQEALAICQMRHAEPPANPKERGALVLSRKNAPLARFAMALLRIQVPCCIRGRDIAGNLLSYCDRFAESGNIVAMLEALKQYETDEVARLEAMGSRGESRLEAVKDQCETIRVLSEGLKTVAELRTRIENLFNDTATGRVVCSTVYRAKGDEHFLVMMLNGSDFDKVWGSSPAAIKERRNAEFVAVTRTLDTYVFVGPRPIDFGADGPAFNPAGKSVEELEGHVLDLIDKEETEPGSVTPEQQAEAIDNFYKAATKKPAKPRKPRSKKTK